MTSLSAVIDRSTICSSEISGASSTIEAIFTAFPSAVESNWKSIAHNTFGAFASTTGPEDTRKRTKTAGPQLIPQLGEEVFHTDAVPSNLGAAPVCARWAADSQALAGAGVTSSVARRSGSG